MYINITEGGNLFLENLKDIDVLDKLNDDVHTST